MTSEITTLSKLLETDFTLIGPLTVVFAEVVPQVTALAEYRVAPLVATPKVQFCALRRLVMHLDCLVPLSWYSLEALSIEIVTVRVGTFFFKMRACFFL